MTYEEFINTWRCGGESIVCHTSGSTGTPKEIFLPRTEMEKSAMRTIDFFSLNESSHLHSCISPDFIGGKMMAVRNELIGARLSWEQPSNRPLKDYDGSPIDLLAVVPSQMEYIIENPDQMPEIRHIIIGGSPIHPGLRKRIANSSLDAWETYGMTETASHIALRKVTEKMEAFQPLEGIRIDIDSDNRLVIDMEGWQKIVTNDIAQINDDGSFTIRGRSDNVIISGGKKIHPEEVEDVLERLLGVDVLVTPAPDEKWGQRVVLIVEDEGRIKDERIISVSKENLRQECVPKEIRHENIRRTSNGKKQRKCI